MSYSDRCGTGHLIPDRFETVRVERPSDQVLLVTLPRPAAANAMKTQMGIDLLEIFAQLFAHPDYCRAVVLTGAGERVFCAGGDLKERNGMSDAQLAGATPHFRAHIKAVIDLLPTARGRFWVPPAPGMIPIVASVCAKRCSGIGTLTVNPQGR